MTNNLKNILPILNYFLNEFWIEKSSLYIYAHTCYVYKLLLILILKVGMYMFEIKQNIFIIMKEVCM